MPMTRKEKLAIAAVEILSAVAVCAWASDIVAGLAALAVR